MQSSHLFKLKEQHLWLSPHRCIYWQEKKALIISDLHFGKTGHFRKSGIAVPQNVFKEDIQRLIDQLQHFQPVKLIVVGDFFHSTANKELDLFKKWRNDFPNLAINLVKGNHDILKENWYREVNIIVSTPDLFVSPFSFCHNCEQIEDNRAAYTFSGHIHPGIRVSGQGKQTLHFPCFYFTSKFCVLPAFSRFTGIATIAPAKADNVFAIVENKIVQLQ